MHVKNKRSSKILKNALLLMFVLPFLFEIYGCENSSTPLQSAINSENESIGLSLLDTLSDQWIIAKIAFEAKNNSVEISAMNKISLPEIIEFIKWFDPVPIKHRRHIMANILPFLQVMNQPNVISEIGEIQFVNVNWHESLSPTYNRLVGKGNLPTLRGEELTFIFKIEKRVKPYSSYWNTEFPQFLQASAQTPTEIFIPAGIDINKLLKPVFELLSQNTLKSIVNLRISDHIDKAAFELISDQKYLKTQMLTHRSDIIRQTIVRNIHEISFLDDCILNDQDSIIKRLAKEKKELLTHVTHYFSFYAALGVDKLSNSLCAAFKAAW